VNNMTPRGHPIVYTRVQRLKTTNTPLQRHVHTWQMTLRQRLAQQWHIACKGQRRVVGGHGGAWGEDVKEPR